MMHRNLILELLPGPFVVARLDPQSEIPPWASGQPFVSVTRTDDETSIVCPQTAVPPDVLCERGFRCLKVRGPLAFSEIGILESLARPLAEAGVSIFAISTFDTDYLLVAEADLDRGLAALSEAGYSVSQ
jgi:hypothetical protein